MAAETKTRGRVWEQKKPSCYLNVGIQEYPAPAKIKHKKKAYMARNCGISLSYRL